MQYDNPIKPQCNAMQSLKPAKVQKYGIGVRTPLGPFKWPKSYNPSKWPNVQTPSISVQTSRDKFTTELP